MIFRPIAILLLFMVPLAACTAKPRPDAVPYHDRADVVSFIDTMAEKHGLDREEVRSLIAGVTPQTRIIELISTPAEAKPWRDYRPIFVTGRRIEAGVNFWREQRQWVEAASERFGVEPEIIVAIIGVETFYGRNQGRFPVLDALVTLGFDYPPRADFFRSELGEFLLLAREEGLDPRTVRGSYAGAMGKGQFISSSYRKYAVDFDGDGRRDLLASWPDAIGSVANYFARHGWQRGAMVAVSAFVEGEDWRDLLGSYKPSHNASALAATGIRTEAKLADDRLYALIELDGAEEVEHWVVADNFYVITRYNRSPLYSMAVWQLAQAIRVGIEEDRP